MPQNKAIKNVILLLCIVGLVYTACESKNTSKNEAAPQNVSKTLYQFEDLRKALVDSLIGEGRVDQALQVYIVDFNEHEQNENWEEAVYSLDRLGNLYRRIARDSLSRASFRRAIQIGKEHLQKDHILLSKAYLAEGNRAYRRNNYEVAIPYIDSAYSVFSRSKQFDEDLQKSLISFKYYAYQKSGRNYDSALKYLELRRSSDSLFDNDTSKLAILFSDYSTTYRDIGDYQRAIAFGQEAMKIALDGLNNEVVQVYDVLEAQFNLSAAYHKAAEFENSTTISTELLLRYSESGSKNVSGLIQYLNLYALSLQSLDDFKKASVQLNRIIILMKENNMVNEDYWSVVMNLGLNYYLDGKIIEGKELLVKALHENQKLFGMFHNNNVSRYRALGGFMSYINQDELSFAYYDSAMRSAILDYTETILELPKTTELELTYEHLLVVERKLQGFKYLYDLNSDPNYLHAIIEYVDFIHAILIKNRESYEATQGKLFLSEDFKEMYATAIEANYILYNRTKSEQEKIGYTRSASLQMNRSKAVLFLEQSNEYDLVKSSNVSKQIKEEYYSLLSRLDVLDEAFYSLTSELATSDSIRRINSERMEVNTSLNNLKKEVFDLIEFSSESSGIDLNDTDLLLTEYLSKNKETAVVEYFVFKKAIYYVASYADTQKLYKTERDEQFEEEFKFLLEEISEKPSYQKNKISFENFKSSSYYIQRRLLGQVFQEMGQDITGLVIIPDEHLSKLPFEILLRSNQSTSFFTADYLIKEYEISYALSTELIGSSSGKQRATKNLIGFGYSGESSSDIRSPLGGLPGTIEEINYLKENVKGNYFMGVEGTMANFLSSARNFDIIHLAIHGISDSTDRYNSRLIFNGDQDNILQTKDLYQANLDSRLVVLSACESGVGEINEGEGTFSIARGFALTGTESIVMSLWKVDDKSSSRLMVEFYKGLNRKQSVSTALINSKKKYLANANEYNSHPYYWSSFVMLGEDIQITPDTQKYWLYSLLLLIMIVGIVMYWQKKRAH